MRNLVLIGMMLTLATVSAYGQEANKEFNIKINAADIQLIGEGLGSLSYSKVAPLMIKLQQQINEQNAPKQVDKTEEKK